MRKVMIFFGFIFVILVVLIAVLYFTFEKPKQEEISIYDNVVNFSIYATENGKYIKTNYIIKIDDQIVSTGETILDYPVIESIPTNRTVIIYNVNKENQDYYTTVYEKNLIGTMDSQRVELKISKPGKLSASNNVKLGVNNQILMKISSESRFNKPFLCFKWSSHIITVSTVYTEVPKLERYELYDKCYNFDREIINESFVFPIDYKVFGTLDKNDFIKIAFIDSDCISSICSTYGLNDKNESSDIGAVDLIYEITNN